MDAPVRPIRVPDAATDPARVPAPQAVAPVRPKLTLRASRGWRALDLREIFQFRDLLIVLAGRDLKLRYKQTMLGVSWVILQPLFAAGIFSFVFGVVAGLKTRDGLPYFLFSFAGLLGWTVFGSTLAKSGTCMTGNAHLVSKVYFPRLILPLSTVASTLVDLSVGLGLMAVLLVAFDVSPTWALLTLPLWVGVLVVMSLGVGLIAAALTVSYRDVQYILPVLIPFLMYASPVAYELGHVPRVYRLPYLLANPLASVIEGFRWSLLGGTPPSWPLVAYSCGVAAGLFAAGTAVFRRLERRFADVI